MLRIQPTIPTRGDEPPFCPNPTCPYHQPRHHEEKWFTPNGTYHTDTFGVVRRYICLHCGKGFGEQTFSLDYYAKKKIDYDRIIEHLVNSSSLRAISRVLRVRVSTVSNRIYRLARQCLWIQGCLLSSMECSEDLVADGFESYTDSKYFPNNIHLLVGKESRFLYFFNHVNLRRKGRMSEKQKEIRTKIDKRWKPRRHALRRSFGEVLEWVIHLIGSSQKQRMTLYTDKKKEYEQALNVSRVGTILRMHKRLKHIRIDSKTPRTQLNPLAPVNIMDRQLRNDCANFRRKTICATRDVNQGMARFAVLAVYHNLIKRYKIDNFPMNHPSHGEVAGIPNGTIDVLTKGIFRVRYYLSHGMGIDGSFRALWFQLLETPMKLYNGYCPKYTAW